MSSTWQNRLDAATSEAEVVGVARDFLATFSPYELARLPEGCRPRKLVDGNDVAAYALILVKSNCDDGIGTARCLQMLSTFFSRASERISAVMASAEKKADQREQAGHRA